MKELATLSGITYILLWKTYSNGWNR